MCKDKTSRSGHDKYERRLTKKLALKNNGCVEKQSKITQAKIVRIKSETGKKNADFVYSYSTIPGKDSCHVASTYPKTVETEIGQYSLGQIYPDPCMNGNNLC